MLSSASSVATEREVEPTGDDKSGPEEAVKGTVEGVKGKAKEVGGAVLGRDDSGKVIRQAGVMGVVMVGGRVRRGDSITVEMRPTPHRPLERV